MLGQKYATIGRKSKRTHELLDANLIWKLENPVHWERQKKNVYSEPRLLVEKKPFSTKCRTHQTFFFYSIQLLLPFDVYWDEYPVIVCDFRHVRQLLRNINIKYKYVKQTLFLLNVDFKTWRCNRAALNILLYGLIIFHCIIDVLWFCRQTQRPGMVPQTLG